MQLRSRSLNTAAPSDADLPESTNDILDSSEHFAENNFPVIQNDLYNDIKGMNVPGMRVWIDFSLLSTICILTFMVSNFREPSKSLSEHANVLYVINGKSLRVGLIPIYTYQLIMCYFRIYKKIGSLKKDLTKYQNTSLKNVFSSGFRSHLEKSLGNTNVICVTNLFSINENTITRTVELRLQLLEEIIWHFCLFLFTELLIQRAKGYDIPLSLIFSPVWILCILLMYACYKKSTHLTKLHLNLQKSSTKLSESLSD